MTFYVLTSTPTPKALAGFIIAANGRFVGGLAGSGDRKAQTLPTALLRGEH